jgi:SPP1 family predicted phage head-tail adaptor
VSPISTTLHDVTPTRLRGLTFLALSEVGHISRGTVTDNQGGGGSVSYATVGTVACRVDPLGGGEGLIADRIDERTTHRITVPPETNVTSKDRFTVVGTGTFEVTAVHARTDEQVRILEATEDF